MIFCARLASDHHQLAGIPVAPLAKGLLGALGGSDTLRTQVEIADVGERGVRNPPPQTRFGRDFSVLILAEYFVEEHLFGPKPNLALHREINTSSVVPDTEGYSKPQ